MTRSARSGANLFGSTGFTVVTLLLSLVSTPLLLRWLGQQQLGAFRAALDWLGYLSLLELGIGGAILPLIASALHAPDELRESRLNAVMSAAFRAYRRVTIIMLFGAAILVPAISILVPSASPEAARDLRIAIAISAAGLLLVPFSPLRAIWDAEQRGFVISLLLTLQSLVITATALHLAWRGWGVSGQMGAILLGAVVFNVALLALSLRRRPGVMRCFVSSDRSADAELWKLNWPTLTLNVCGRVGLLTDNIIIAFVLGPAAVVPFFITQRLAQIVAGQLQNIGGATWAGFVQLRATPDGERLFVRRLIELTQLLLVLGFAAMIPIAAFNQQFVNLWVGSTQFGGTTLTLLACVNGLLLAVLSLWGWMFSGAGHAQGLVAPALVSAGVNFAVSVGMTLALRQSHPHLATLGPLIGTAIAMTFISAPWMAILLRRRFNVPLRSMLHALMLPCVMAIPVTALAWALSRLRFTHDWAGVIASMSFIAVVSLALSWMFVFDSDARTVWHARARSIFGRSVK